MPPILITQVSIVPCDKLDIFVVQKCRTVSFQGCGSEDTDTTLNVDSIKRLSSLRSTVLQNLFI